MATCGLVRGKAGKSYPTLPTLLVHLSCPNALPSRKYSVHVVLARLPLGQSALASVSRMSGQERRMQSLGVLCLFLPPTLGGTQEDINQSLQRLVWPASLARPWW